MLTSVLKPSLPMKSSRRTSPTNSSARQRPDHEPAVPAHGPSVDVHASSFAFSQRPRDRASGENSRSSRFGWRSIDRHDAPPPHSWRLRARPARRAPLRRLDHRRVERITARVCLRNDRDARRRGRLRRSPRRPERSTSGARCRCRPSFRSRPMSTRCRRRRRESGRPSRRLGRPRRSRAIARSSQPAAMRAETARGVEELRRLTLDHPIVARP